ELAQHFAPVMAGIADAAVQLAVRERAGATLTELGIGRRIEHTAPPKAPRVLGALAHVLAALENDGTKAHLRQHQRAHETARPCADNDWTLLDALRRTCDDPVARVGCRIDVAIALEARAHDRLVTNLGVDS